jgi:hypothetical protein
MVQEEEEPASRAEALVLVSEIVAENSLTVEIQARQLVQEDQTVVQVVVVEPHLNLVLAEALEWSS